MQPSNSTPSARKVLECASALYSLDKVQYHNIVALKHACVIMYCFCTGHTNVVSLDLSPCGRHLLLGTSSRKDMYHMNRVGAVNMIVHINNAL